MLKMIDFAVAVAAVLAVQPASAAVISYVVPARTLGDNNTPNVLPGFDAVLGSLDGATVTYEGTASGRAASGFTIGPRPETITVSPYLLIFDLPTDGFSRTQSLAFAPFEITPTYTATGGYSASFSRELSGTLGFAPTVATAGGPGGVISYAIAGGYGISPNPATYYDNGMGFIGTATVTYDYTPFGQSVPEPASIALFGIGLAGLAAVRRRAV